MASFIDVDLEFPTAEKTRDNATKRKFINRDNSLRKLFDQQIDPAVRDGYGFCTISRWDINDEVKAFLEAKGYVIETPENAEDNGELIIRWGINE